MRCDLTGGTDAASMVLFDPAALPPDFDERIQKGDVPELFESLMLTGRLYWINEGGDGEFTTAVVLDEEIPEELRPFARDVERLDNFEVPSGRLYFTGAEYAFCEDDARLRKYPGMGESAQIPPGTYEFVYHEMDYPDGHEEGLLRAGSGTWDYLVFRLTSALFPIGCLVIVLAGISAFLLGWRMWLKTVLPATIVIILMPLMLSFSGAYRRVANLRDLNRRRFPDSIVVLRNR